MVSTKQPPKLRSVVRVEKREPEASSVTSAPVIKGWRSPDLRSRAVAFEDE
jgi:hypothetical protein